MSEQSLDSDMNGKIIAVIKQHKANTGTIAREIVSLRLKAEAQYERATKAENANATLRADVIELREALRSLYDAYEEARADGDRYFGTWDGEDTIGRLLAGPPQPE